MALLPPPPPISASDRQVAVGCAMDDSPLYTLNIIRIQWEDDFRCVYDFESLEEVREFIENDVMDEDEKEFYDYKENPYTVPSLEELKAHDFKEPLELEYGNRECYYTSFFIIKRQ
jgi:hypothetical protein